MRIQGSALVSGGVGISVGEHGEGSVYLENTKNDPDGTMCGHCNLFLLRGDCLLSVQFGGCSHKLTLKPMP
jgi:hypothetical protein